MTYTADSAILSQGSATAPAIDAWFAARGKVIASSYAPDKQYRPAPDHLGALIIAECHRHAPRIVNHDLCAAQIAHECAYWQSRYARERNNPSGLGSINSDPDQAIWFATPQDGIRATVAHLLTYAAGEGEWTADNPRYQAVKERGWVGVARTLRGLNGRWAWPGTTYGQSIASGANDLVTFAEHDSWGPAPERTIRQAFIPATNANRPGHKIAPIGTVVHDTGNTSAGADADAHRQYVSGPQQGGTERTSYHFVVDDHEIIQLLPLDEMGHHALSHCNTTRIGIEACINRDGDWDRTLDNLAWLLAWLESEHGLTDHIQHFDCTGKNCPGRIRATPGAWDALMGAVDAYLPPSGGGGDGGSDDPDVLLMRGIPIVRGFRAHVLRIGETVYPADPITGAIAVFGYPLGPEYPTVFGSAQPFERYTLEWWRDNAPPFDIIGTLRGASEPEAA